MNKNLVLCHVLFECCLMLKKVCEVGMCSDCFTMKKIMTGEIILPKMRHFFILTELQSFNYYFIRCYRTGS